MSVKVPVVYLAGPISGLTFEQSQDTWRTQAAAELEFRGIEARTPLRGKDFLRGRGALESNYLNEKQLSSPKGIVGRDFNDVRTSDALLANFRDGIVGRVSIGTCWELGAAYALRIPVVGVIAAGSIHDHAFLTQTCVYVFEDLEEAVEGVAYVLNR